MNNYNDLLDCHYQNLDANAIAEFEAWIDSQDVDYPSPEDLYPNYEGCDPDYEDDF